MLDITKPTYDGHCTQFNQFVNGKTLIVNALPFHQNINLYKACFELGVPYFDLSEDDALDKFIDTLKSDKIPFTMPHCGLAPGMSTVVANYLLQDIENPTSVKIRVGALSQNASNKLRYYTSWSGEGLVNEYIGDCQVLVDGKYNTVDALTGYEKLTLDGSEYEAFNTSGGLGTFAKSLDGKYDSLNLNYKTLRRVGHHDYVDFLFNEMNIPQKDLTKIFSRIPKTRKDEVILYASVSGVGKEDERTYFKVFRPDGINGRSLTAIEYTTAIGLLAMVELYILGKIPQDGYVRQEDVSWKDTLSTTFGSLYKE
jgi:saccharopine dehydrogenase-like NADP-dependent oxidoreductase